MRTRADRLRGRGRFGAREADRESHRIHRGGAGIPRPLAGGEWRLGSARRGLRRRGQPRALRGRSGLLATRRGGRNRSDRRAAAGTMNALDIARLRAETPGCAVSAFFNHSGASLPSGATLAAITSHLEREALYGGMEAAAAVGDALQSARATAAALINARPDDVAFTSSASAAIGLAFAALPPLRAGDRILVGRQEWGGNVATYSAAAAR